MKPSLTIHLTVAGTQEVLDLVTQVVAVVVNVAGGGGGVPTRSRV